MAIHQCLFQSWDIVKLAGLGYKCCSGYRNLRVEFSVNIEPSLGLCGLN
jgi:hypothetical protein